MKCIMYNDRVSDISLDMLTLQWIIFILASDFSLACEVAIIIGQFVFSYSYQKPCNLICMIHFLPPLIQNCYLERFHR